MLVVRAAKAGDREGLTAVIARAAIEARRLFRDRSEEAVQWQCTRPKAQELVALLDGEIVGRIQCTVGDACIQILDVVVLPEYRRLGVARRLVEVLADTARKVGIRRLSITVANEDETVRIFQRLGFRTARNVSPPAETKRPADLTMERAVAPNGDDPGGT
jgi:N-acetylglutamate synthase-like GNAT family acetyltransferase